MKEYGEVYRDPEESLKSFLEMQNQINSVNLFFEIEDFEQSEHNFDLTTLDLDINNFNLDFYKDQSSSLSARLAKIDKQELLLRARYTEQFSKMEEAVTGSKASQDCITQLVDGWNKA